LVFIIVFNGVFIEHCISTDERLALAGIALWEGCKIELVPRDAVAAGSQEHKGDMR
jgi:hypothetical protein